MTIDKSLFGIFHFFLNIDQHHVTPINGINMCQVLAANNFVEHMLNVIGLAKRRLLGAQQRYEYYDDEKTKSFLMR